MLRSSGLDEERKRHHDKAVEQLQAAQAEWSGKRNELPDWISEDLHRKGHAVQTFRDVDDAMREYSQVTGKKLTPLGPEPKLTSTCRAVAKETVRSPSLYWGRPRPA